MTTLFAIALTIGAFGLLVGVAYPLCILATYPIYRRRGGKESLREYLADL